MTTAEELALVDAALQSLYAAGVQEWSEASERVVQLRFDMLTARKDQLENKLAQEAGSSRGVFQPIQPIDH